MNNEQLTMNKTEEIISTMSARDREIIRLRFHEEKPVAEIAKIMGMNIVVLEDLIIGILSGIRQRIIGG